MKIAYICRSSIPSRVANSVHVMRMSAALTRLGHEVTLITPDLPGREPGVTDDFAYYGVAERFRIIRVSRPPIRGWRYVDGIMAARAARRLQPDLVYCRDNDGACLAAAMMGLLTLFEIHQPLTGRGRIRALVFRRLIRSPNFRGLVVITEALRGHYEDQYPQLVGRIVVAPDAADEPAAEAADAPVDAPGDREGDTDRDADEGPASVPLRVGYVGHLYAGRGIDLLVRLAQSLPALAFEFVGGSDAAVREWQARTAGIDNIRFHGFMAPARTDRFRAACDILVAPYQASVSAHGSGDTAAWMSPLKIFEYMATGRPIVCSDLPVLREILGHEDNALLCPSDDVDAWRAALERLATDPDLRAQLGSRARSDFRAHYTWDQRARRVVDSVVV